MDRSPPESVFLDVSDLVVEFSRDRRRPPLRAVDNVSISVRAGETLGLVGESGSGKTTLGRAIVGLVPVAHGRVSLDGIDITHASCRQRRQLSADMQVVFQDPYSSLNPTRTIGDTLAETLRVHRKLSRIEERDRVGAMLERVGLPREAGSRYPAHFSGGQRQRIAIARSLIADPRLVICDEPVSALDLSVQAQVLNLLRELQRELGLSYLFIAHDLAVVRHISHRIVVLYHGRVMEEGDAADVYSRPAHPYTRALLDAVPKPDPKAQQCRHVPLPQARVTVAAGNACPFAERCPHVIDRCRSESPQLVATPEGSLVACHRWSELRISAVEARPGASGVVVS